MLRKTMTPEMASRITLIPGLCGGRPTIRGMRIRVADVLDLLAEGETREVILEDYPYLEDEDITAALQWAAETALNAKIPAE
jgi:uncharacterized protein (DUF433 family)